MAAASELERLYDQHAQALFAFLLNLTRNEADARDALQDIFMKLSTRPGLLDEIDKPRAFLIRLGHNQAIDLIRRRVTREKNYEQLTAESFVVFAESEDPDANAFRQELSKAMANLPVDQRAVVHLKLWEGMTFDAIAAALEISPNTAASRYRYGIDKLRDQLRPFYEEIKNHGRI